jgi:hypothetical protein
VIAHVARTLEAMGFTVFVGSTGLSAGSYVVDVGGMDILQGPQLGMSPLRDGRWRLGRVDGHPEGSFFGLEFDTLDDALAFIEPMSQEVRREQTMRTLELLMASGRGQGSPTFPAPTTLEHELAVDALARHVGAVDADPARTQRAEPMDAAVRDALARCVGHRDLAQVFELRGDLVTFREGVTQQERHDIRGFIISASWRSASRTPP